MIKYIKRKIKEQTKQLLCSRGIMVKYRQHIVTIAKLIIIAMFILDFFPF